VDILKDLIEKKRILEHELNYLVEITNNFVEPMKKLDEIQIAIMSILLWQVQSITRGSIVLGKRGEVILNQYIAKLSEICPDLPKIELIGDPCFDAEVGYVSALKKCRDEGIREEECDEANGYMGVLMDCAMAKIENLGTIIEKVRNDLKLPKPRL
jgi:hypothetical protein